MKKRKVRIGYSINFSTQLLFRDIEIDFLIADNESLQKISVILENDIHQQYVSGGSQEGMGSSYRAKDYVINIWSFYETEDTPVSIKGLQQVFAPRENKCGGHGPQ